MPRKWLPVFLTLLSLVATSSVAHAWNHIGHWVIASIAFQITRRSDQAEDRGLSQKHPAYADLWSNRETNGPDGGLGLLSLLQRSPPAWRLVVFS